MYDPQWDLPILSTTSQNGGADWSNHSYSHSTNLVYYPYGTNPVAHWNGAAANGQRAIGQYQTGGILAYDASTGEVAWQNHLGTDMSHGQGPLTTASDLLFVGQIDGRLLAMDAVTGDVLWEFQTGSGIAARRSPTRSTASSTSPIFAAGSTNPYGDSVTQGDSLWAFKLGGTYTTESGSQEGPDTAPLSIRRPVSGAAVAGETVGNTVLLARSQPHRRHRCRADSVSQNGMQPTHLRVPVGTTVTFRNPGAETFPNFPNLKPHCATQFFEGEFNVELQPGETYQHTFDRAGEYFFNDCTDPRPTGKIEVYLEPQDQPGALRFTPTRLDLGSGHRAVHRGERQGHGALRTARGLHLRGRRRPGRPAVVDADPGIEGDGQQEPDHRPVRHGRRRQQRADREVTLTLRANVLNAQGVQEQLSSSATVTVVK